MVLVTNIIATITFFLILNVVQCQKCSSPEITEDEFQFLYENDEDLELDFSDEVIKIFPMVNTKAVNSTKNDFNVKYIDARMDGNNLEIFTTDNFKDYAKQEGNEKIILEITFICDDSSTRQLIFRQNIARTNVYSPEFSQPTYELKLSLPLHKGYDLTNFKEISAKDYDIFDNNVKFSSEGSNIFEVRTSNEKSPDGKTFYASVILLRELLVLEDDVEFSILASDSGSPLKSSSARVVITSNPENSLSPKPRFQKPIYNGHLNNDLNLNLEQIILDEKSFSDEVKLTLEGGDYDLFKLSNDYNILTIDLKRKLLENDLFNKTFMTFMVIATIPGVFDDKTAVIITFPQRAKGTVKKSLYISHLDENEDQKQDVMTNKNDDCEFIIVDMYPNDREYVKINTERNMIIAQYLDYESTAFTDMLVPQIQVQLQLKCPETGVGIPISNEIELLDKKNVFESRSLVLTNDIGHYSDKSMLSIIINDMNDNTPYFIYPPHDNFLIGYPEPSVALELLPKCVIQVEALDKDSGLNAAIKYDIEDNDYFWIDHNTGAIQPYSNALEESKSIALKVYARDRLGENGNSISMTINIKIFESKHLLLLRISNETLNMTEFLKDLKEQTLLNVYLLQSAIITSKPDLRRMERKITAEAWVYAVDENENFIINNDLKSEINKLENDIEIISKIYSEVKEPVCIQNVCEQLATTGFIIAISTLSVILASVIVTFIAVWWCFWRPTSATCKSFLNPNNDWQSKFNDSDGGSSVVDPEQVTNYKEPELHTPQLGSLNDLNGERRKSQSTVTFNQLVKRIDINVDDEDHEQYNEKL